MMEIIRSYEQDLQQLRRKHKAIADKRVEVVHKVLGKEKITYDDQRTDDEKAQQALLSSMITSTTYALNWLKTGHDGTNGKLAEKSIPKYLREQLWGDVDSCLRYRGEKSRGQLVVEDESRRQSNDFEKEAKLEQLQEILSVFSTKERQLFELKYTAMLSDKECGEHMGLATGTIKSMRQRIRNKIDYYFEYGHQMELF